MNNNTGNPVIAILLGMDSFYVYDVIWWQGEGSVSGCTASCWSLLFTQVSHMTIVYFEWHDLSNWDIGPNSLAMKFSIPLSLSGGIIFVDKIILDLKLLC